MLRRFIRYLSVITAAIGITMIMVTPQANAATPVSGSHGACSAGAWWSLPYCIDMQPGYPQNLGCSEPNYFGPVNDRNGVPVNWTWSNGGKACLKAQYNPPANGGNCAFYFYVPSNYATANVVFGYWTTDGVKHYASLNEAQVSGWTFAFRARNVNRIEFQDNNGQTGTQIGWGANNNFGWWIDNCL